MPRKNIDENAILEELHKVPDERWRDVLIFIRSLQCSKEPPIAERPILSGADLAGSDLIGIWANRTDIVEGQEFARQLRDQAEHRREGTDATGH